MRLSHRRVHLARALTTLLVLFLSVPVLAAASPAPAARVLPAAAPPVASAVQAGAGWDDHFGVPGVYNGDVTAAAGGAGGDLYLGGAFSAGDASVGANGVARWDGARWHALGEGLSGGQARVRALAVRGEDVYVAGSFTTAGGVAARQLARWDGARWHALGAGAGPVVVENGATREGSILALAVAPNGDLYVGGSFTRIDATPANGVARWDGARWHALGAGVVDRGVLGGEVLFPATVNALAVAPDGALYAGGQFSDAGAVSARNVARWDGAAWAALGAGVGGGDIFDGNQVTALAVDGGRLYVGGAFTRAGDADAANIAVWDGTDWTALGGGLTSELSSPAPVLTLLVQGGALYAGGAFTSAGDQSVAGLARWDGARWSTVGPPLEAAGFRVTVRALAPAGAAGLFAGGAFERAGGRTVNGVARWDGAAWKNLGEGVTLLGDSSAVVKAVDIDAAGRIYVGGLINQAGGLPVNNIAVWDGGSWQAMGGGVTPGPDGTVEALLVVGDDVYVGGRFTQAGGRSASRIARWNIPTQSWAPVGAGFDGPVLALAFGGGTLYAGGSFARADAAPARDVAAWDGQSWRALGGAWEIFEVLDTGNEAGTYVEAMAYASGELFIGGHFRTIHRKGTDTQNQANYAVVHNVVGFATASGDWFQLGEGGPAGVGVTTGGATTLSTNVYALAVVNGGLYIGGSFNRAGALVAPALARWDVQDGRWSTPGAPASSGDVSVRALAALGGSLLVGGAFTSVGGLEARSVAVLDTVSGGWGDLDGGVGWRNGVARVNAAALRPDGAVFGGELSQAGPHPSVGLARYAGAFGGESPPPVGDYVVFLPLARR